MQTSDTAPLYDQIFDDPDFVEMFRSIVVELRVLGTEEDPAHPDRPRINFGGSLDGNAIIVGFVHVTPDDQIRWHFVRRLLVELAAHSNSQNIQTSGENGNAIWRYALRVCNALKCMTSRTCRHLQL